MSRKIKKDPCGFVVLILLIIAMAAHISCESDRSDTQDSPFSGKADGNGDGDKDEDRGNDTDPENEYEGNTNNGGDSDADKDGPGDDGCAALTDEAQNKTRPADIVFVVDNSPSMQNETAAVQRNMNRFSRMIVDADVDVRIVLISDTKSGFSFGICIQAPLGSGNCPNDTKLPEYKHVVEPVGSTDSLVLIHSTYNQWKDSLRPDAQLHFVVVTDDDSRDMNAAQFKNLMAGVDPPQTDFVFHGISASANWNTPGVCNRISTLRGRVYEKLIQDTGGVWSDLCLQDFDPVFDELAGAMIESSMSCEWEIPPPPEGETLDPEKVNVVFEGDKNSETIPHVSSKADCDKADKAWYYDDEQNPQKVFLCPGTCNKVRSTASSKISIEFGCERIDAVVR